MTVSPSDTEHLVSPLFGYGGLLEPSDCDGHLLEQVAASEVVRLLGGGGRVSFGSGGLFLQTQQDISFGLLFNSVGRRDILKCYSYR